MSEEEKEFMQLLYQKLLAVLVNEEKLTEAKESFQVNKSTPTRYSGRETLGLQLWEESQAIRLSAALFEALVQTQTYYFQHNNSELATRINAIDHMKIFLQQFDSYETELKLKMLIDRLQELDFLVIESSEEAPETPLIANEGLFKTLVSAEQSLIQFAKDYRLPSFFKHGSRMNLISSAPEPLWHPPKQ